MNAMPSTSDLNHPGKPAVQFALGERQVAALGFLAFLLLGSLTAAAYVAGRAGTASPPVSAATSASALPAPQRRVPEKAPAATPVKVAEQVSKETPPSVEKLIVVEPAITPLPAIKPLIRPITVVASAELGGQSFWQVAALDRKMAEDAHAGLAQQNLPVMIAEGPSPEMFRVLVGPLNGPDHTAKIKTALESGEFQPFYKRY